MTTLKTILTFALFATVLVQASGAGANSRIISGDWVAGCVEQYNNGSASVYCDRFGGFVQNVYPAGCEGGSMFACQAMTICDLARRVSIIDPADFTKLQDDVLQCEGEVRGPATLD